MMGSLARTLMNRAIAIAGDGTKDVSISLLLGSTYDPATGTYTADEDIRMIGRAVMGMISESEVNKYRLTNTTHKAVIAMVAYESAGNPPLPDPQDKILIDGKQWLIDKVQVGSMNQSIAFYVCEA